MKKYSHQIRKIGMILLGNLMYAFAVAYFVLPVGLITGGTTGIALTVNHYFGMDISLFVTIFNGVMFLTGLLVLGKKFAATTLISSFVYPFFLKIVQTMVEITGVLSQDSLLCTIFAGLLIGAGIGIVIREGASTGGMDIPPLVINKKTGLPVGAILNVCDILILVLQMTFSNREQVLYGILMVCIYTYVLDRILIRGNSKIQIKIISKKYEQINEAIATQVDRGTTLFEVEGGYTRDEMYAILTVVDQRQLFLVNELVQEIDPDAFIIIGQVKEVRGRGFTKSKEYQNN